MKLSNKPLVSIVVPCLNRARFLAATIDSIIEQDYSHIECIVVDGGSIDETIKILKGYGSRIKWISEPDDGHADAINKGWRMSQGKILAWLNVDDCYVVPSAISQAVSYLQEHREVDVVYGDFGEISIDGKVVKEIIKPKKWNLVYAVKYCDYIIPQHSSFMRRSILEKVNWLDPEFRNGKDHELWLRIGLAGIIRYFPVCFAYWRNCPGLSQQLDMSEAKIKITKKFFNNPALPAPFNSKHWQRRALSNSYLVASVYALLGNHYKFMWNYLFKAIFQDPLNLFYIMEKFTRNLIGSKTPISCKKATKKLSCGRKILTKKDKLYTHVL